MKYYDYWKKSQITDISMFSYWLHQKGVGIYVNAELVYLDKYSVCEHFLKCLVLFFFIGEKIL
jgi:hypothetical protein